MSYSRPPYQQRTAAEIDREGQYDDALEAAVKRGLPISREQALHMLNTLPIPDFGAKRTPWSAVQAEKTTVERMPHGAVVPRSMVLRVFKMWRPWL
jgi:hypothetical protein